MCVCALLKDECVSVVTVCGDCCERENMYLCVCVCLCFVCVCVKGERGVFLVSCSDCVSLIKGF